MNRRNAIVGAAYVAPLILTFAARPTLAEFGSCAAAPKAKHAPVKGAQHRLGPEGFYRLEKKNG